MLTHFDAPSNYVIPDERIDLRRCGNTHEIRYDIQEAASVSNDEQSKLEDNNVRHLVCQQILMKSGYDRATLINAIITDRYPNGQMEAIINNHLLDPSDQEHEAEFIAMQSFRSKAKSIASIIMSLQ